MNDQTLLVVWTIQNSSAPDDITDYWEACSNIYEANRRYDEVLALDNIYIANICKVIRSTDYECEPE